MLPSYKNGESAYTPICSMFLSFFWRWRPMDRNRFLLFFLAVLGGFAPSFAMSHSPDVAKRLDGSAVRVCVDVQIAPDMWLPGSVEKANQNLSSLLRGAIFRLVRKDGGDPYGDQGKHKIVRTNDYAVCRESSAAKANLRYEYLANGSPYKVYMSVHDEDIDVEKNYTHDISKEVHFAKMNTNKIYIIEDIRQRAEEIYDLLKKHLIEE